MVEKRCLFWSDGRCVKSNFIQINTPFCMTFCFMLNVLCMCFAMKRRILHMSIDHHPSIIIDMKTFINKTVYKVSHVCCILTSKPS